MRIFLLLLFSTSLFGLATTAMAADIEPTPEQLAFAATVAFGYEYTNFNEAEIDEGIIGNGGLLEGALLLRNLGASNFNAQVDASYYLNDLSNFENDGSSVGEEGVGRSHFGGALFWRDETLGLIGIDAALGQTKWNDDKINYYRVGGRFEYYLGDYFTLGGRGGYIHEKEASQLQGASGYYANAFARAYVLDSLALTASLDYAKFRHWDPAAPLTIKSFTGEAEFDLANSINVPVSVFAGGRYSDQDDGEAVFNEVQGFVGLKFYFGTDGTLSSKQRNNTIDNLNTPFDRIVNREGT